MTVTGINCGWNKLKRKGTSINTVEPVFYGTPAFRDQSVKLQCNITVSHYRFVYYFEGSKFVP